MLSSVFNQHGVVLGEAWTTADTACMRTDSFVDDPTSVLFRKELSAQVPVQLDKPR
jgi:hypothetical protein